MLETHYIVVAQSLQDLSLLFEKLYIILVEILSLNYLLGFIFEGITLTASFSPDF